MIITVSREFGSGGRELSKRLSETLQMPYYDYEIIEMIAREHGFDEQYLHQLSEKSIQAVYSLTIGRRFATTPNYVAQQTVKIAVEQRKLIERLAAQEGGVFVGRCADIILQDYQPFNIFVYGSKEAKLQRCIERSPEDEQLSGIEIERKMREVDKNRAWQRKFFTDTKWGAKENYHLCLNTSGLEIKNVVPILADYIMMWFAKKERL